MTTGPASDIETADEDLDDLRGPVPRRDSVGDLAREDQMTAGNQSIEAMTWSSCLSGRGCPGLGDAGESTVIATRVDTPPITLAASEQLACECWLPGISLNALVCGLARGGEWESQGRPFAMASSSCGRATGWTSAPTIRQIPLAMPGGACDMAGRPIGSRSRRTDR